MSEQYIGIWRGGCGRPAKAKKIPPDDFCRFVVEEKEGIVVKIDEDGSYEKLEGALLTLFNVGWTPIRACSHEGVLAVLVANQVIKGVSGGPYAWMFPLLGEFISDNVSIYTSKTKYAKDMRVSQ